MNSFEFTARAVSLGYRAVTLPHRRSENPTSTSMSSRPASLIKNSAFTASLLLTPCRTRLLRACYFVLSLLLSPAPLRTVLALFTHIMLYTT